MSVLLAIGMFVLFIALDYAIGFGSRSATGDAKAASAPEVGKLLPPGFVVEPVWVSGYQLPDDFHYHLGHTWVRQLGPDTVLVGLDDFARQLIGEAEGVEAPPAGKRVRQGDPAFVVRLDDRAATLVAPVDGEVIEVNPRLAMQPQIVTEDPYSCGWIMKLRCSDLTRNLRNLLSGHTAHKWIEDSRERLELQLMALSGSVLMDGGKPVADFASHLDKDDWRRLVGEFLLT